MIFPRKGSISAHRDATGLIDRAAIVLTVQDERVRTIGSFRE
jgi:hypothetical protein